MDWMALHRDEYSPLVVEDHPHGSFPDLGRVWQPRISLSL
jgi:hypothetical protein